MSVLAHTSITLRPARVEEVEVLTELCLRSKAHWGYDAAFMEACHAELTISESDVAVDTMGVAEASGRLAGLVQLDFQERDCVLEKLFVEPATIGTGVGGELMRWAVGRAIAHGCSRMIIDADPDAGPFYRRMGAVDDGVVASGSIPGRMLPRLVLDLG